ncbi:MAG: hypothetical protein NXI24_23200 [bacterium]|nr:hypothetical protein [bacterium]
MKIVLNAVGDLFRAAIGPRRFFTNGSRDSLPGTALRGLVCLLILAALLLTIVAAVSGAAWESAAGEYLSGKGLPRSDFPALSAMSDLPYEFPFIWIALIALIGVLRFALLALLGERGGSGLVAMSLTMSLAVFSLAPMLVNGLFAAVTGNLFPIGADYSPFDAFRIFFAIAAVVITWLWEGWITVAAYGAVFGQATGRGVLIFLLPWVLMYLLTYIV